MKHQFLATADVNTRMGDVLITAKKGETLSLSGNAAQVASNVPELEYKGVTAETKEEQPLVEQIVEQSETLEDLMKHTREQLVEKGTALGLSFGKENKDMIAVAILEKRRQNQNGGNFIEVTN